ncbi:MAG: aminotransferase class V-fold PLP-dependent enzyme [Eubacteriales bacterium]|nr:aminotransferase class V-fold PLP-dependent enzyme [Eubacteriales bacterium]
MINLNQAATTYPKPQCVLDAHAAALLQEPVGQFRSAGSPKGPDVFEACRRNLGSLFGIRAWERIFFSSGATDSANAVIYGLGLNGKHVVTTQTEHNSILRPLLNLTEQVGNVTIVPCDADGWVEPEAIEEAITEDTAAVFVNHCSNVTGMIQEIAEIGKVTAKKGILLIVDASQSAGCIPIRADEWGIDVLIFTGHKSLFGVQGTGGYYVRPGIPFRPYRFGGTGRDSRRLTYEDGAYEYEPGTQNTPGIAALNAGVSYILETGVENIARKEQEQMAAIYRGLGEIPQGCVYGDPGRNKGPVMSFNIRGLNPSDAAYILQNGYGITVRTGLHCAPLIHQAMGTQEYGTVRVSISALTKEAEIKQFLCAVREIAAGIEEAKA